MFIDCYFKGFMASGSRFLCFSVMCGRYINHGHYNLAFFWILKGYVLFQPFNAPCGWDKPGVWWWYCWWTKSCTTKDDDYPIIYRVLTIPGGAGFCPSTVSHTFLSSKDWEDLGLVRWLRHLKNSDKAFKSSAMPWSLSYGARAQV